MKGVRLLANPVGDDAIVISGESGAVPVGLIDEICTNQEHIAVKERLKFDSTSKILICSTEGDTDPKVYNQILEREEG
jgi:diaminopropionate ammonia-lyase